MQIIMERIKSLKLAASDCERLEQIDLDKILAVAKLIGNNQNCEAVEMFSIANSPKADVKRRLDAFGEGIALVCWPAFREAFKIKWSIFTDQLEELWHPGSDDIVAVFPRKNRALAISHEEEIRLFVSIDSLNVDLPV